MASPLFEWVAGGLMSLAISWWGLAIVRNRHAVPRDVFFRGYFMVAMGALTAIVWWTSFEIRLPLLVLLPLSIYFVTKINRRWHNADFYAAQGALSSVFLCSSALLTGGVRCGPFTDRFVEQRACSPGGEYCAQILYDDELRYLQIVPRRLTVSTFLAFPQTTVADFGMSDSGRSRFHWRDNHTLVVSGARPSVSRCMGVNLVWDGTISEDAVE